MAVLDLSRVHESPLRLESAVGVDVPLLGGSYA